MKQVKETPMMSQYRSIRRSLPDEVLLFFRLGDFYEMFFDDAVRAAAILDITLTKRNEVPMCGVPYHAAAGYLERLIKAGVKVALCEQVESPEEAKGVVRREVTRIVTPGTIIDEMQIEERQNNYIAALFHSEGSYGIAMLDCSTGSCWLEECNALGQVETAFNHNQPTECLVAEEQLQEIQASLHVPLAYTQCESWQFDYGNAEDRVAKQFGVPSLLGLGLADASVSLQALGALFGYLQNTLHHDLGHIQTVKMRAAQDALYLDETTVINLELVKPIYTNRASQNSTLLSVIDSTCTPMGGRMMREWLLRPLNKTADIRQRLDAVETLTKHQMMLTQVRDYLKNVRDLERLISRIGSAATGNPRDVQVLSSSLGQLPALQQLLDTSGTQLQVAAAALEPLPELTHQLDSAIQDEVPIHLRDGGIISDGYSAELDQLRRAATEGRSWLASFQSQEAERTGIKNLKVRFNKVFGYYIEISKAALDKVPENYQRKQTLTNAERFVVPELTQYADQILGAEERAIALEQTLFKELKEQILKQLPLIQKNARNISYIDVIASLAERALSLNYVRPDVSDGTELHIQEGRHPVVEQLVETERFVPNDVLLNQQDQQLVLLTGPNMAGKSTYIRQVALITIMAHMGSFVPAAAAHIGRVDRVFTRVGASDDLARGRSTFMVEMQETANILNQATDRSLIVLDEIGRGTSTYDGISIAWSVAEYLCENPSLRPRTLFATHYHELTDLSETHNQIKNFSVAVKEQGDQIIFLRKIIPEAADKSYGIQVARLAGLPVTVIEKAMTILTSLEQAGHPDTMAKRAVRKRQLKPSDNQNQLDLL